MSAFEQRIAEAVNEKLNDGTVEKLVEKCLEEGVSDALNDTFRYNGDARELLKEKLNEIIVPAIEHHDFNQYLTKLDAILTEIVNSTNLSDNKEILKNFAGLMKEPEMKEIKLSVIFKMYCRHVSENIDTGDLNPCCDDGEPYYEHVTARMEVEHEDRGWLVSDYDDCSVKFTCDEDEDLNHQIKLFKRKSSERWKILGHDDSVDICSLRGLSDFEIFIMTLKRAFVEIVMDKEYECDDDIDPEEKPEWSLD